MNFREKMSKELFLDPKILFGETESKIVNDFGTGLLEIHLAGKRREAKVTEMCMVPSLTVESLSTRLEELKKEDNNVKV